jgi:predicted DsbA family dithiol-disulfide isomerase
MKIEIWSDFVCPFCYIGKRHLEKALEQFEGRGEVSTAFRSFQLDPGASAVSGKTMYDILSRKYGMTIEQAKQTTANVAVQAEQAGLRYDFDAMIPANTEAAHRLSHYAAEKGKGGTFTERTMQAFFTEGRDINSFETLADLAEEAGLVRSEALQVLESGQYRDYVLKDQEKAAAAGVSGVPFFVFNEKYAVSGAQPPHKLLEVLEQVRTESSADKQGKEGGPDCSGGSCSI